MSSEEENGNLNENSSFFEELERQDAEKAVAASSGGGGSAAAPAAASRLVAVRKSVALQPEVKEVPKSKGRKGKKMSSPSDSASFYTARVSQPTLFTIDDDGNLSVPPIGTSPAKTIYLSHYKSATPAALEALIDARKVELQQVQRKYDEKKKALRQIMNLWLTTKAPGSDTRIIEFQRELLELDARRAELLSPNRFTHLYENPLEHKIIMTDKSLRTGIKYDVLALRRRPTTFAEEVVETEIPWEPRMLSEEAKEMEDLEAAGAGAGAEEEMERISFGSPAAGGESTIYLLSIDLRKPFTFEGTQYQFVIQAYENLRMKTLEGKALIYMESVKSQATASGVRKIGSKVVGQPKNALEILTNILRVYVGQHADVKEALLETGETELVNTYPVSDLFMTSGLAAEQIDTPKAEWPGLNTLGKAWMILRKEIIDKGGLQKGGFLDEFVDTGFTDHAKTDAEAKKERLSYILAAKRRAAAGAPF